MDKTFYNKISVLIESITANIGLSAFCEEKNLSAESTRHILFARDEALKMLDLFPEMELELEVCFADRGKEAFLRYCDLLSEKFSKATKEPLETIYNPGFYQYLFPVTPVAILRLKAEVLVYRQKYIRGGVEAELYNDIDYISFFSFGVLVMGLVTISNKKKQFVTSDPPQKKEIAWWKGKEVIRTQVQKRLINEKLIDKNSILFGEKKVKWFGTNAQLVELIEEHQKKDNIFKPKGRATYGPVIENNFIDKNGVPLKNLKNAKSQVKATSKSRR